MTVDCSLGETETLVMRAGRGASLSWGQAREAGWAVVRLAAAGLPSVTWFASTLPKIHATPYAERCPVEPFHLGNVVANTALPATAAAVRPAARPRSFPGFCPVALGCSLADLLPTVAQRSATTVIEFETVWSPALIAGFVLPVTSRLARSVRLKFNQTEMVIVNGLIAIDGDPDFLSVEQAEHVVVTFTHPDDNEQPTIRTPDTSSGMTRCAITDQVYAQLQAYAHKTYVPSNAATRAEGAGAGLTDND